MTGPDCAACHAEAAAARGPFLLFAGDRFYPNGGWEDFRSAHPTLEDARRAALAVEAAAHGLTWWHIVHLHDGRIVAHEDDALFPPEPPPPLARPPYLQVWTEPRMGREPDALLGLMKMWPGYPLRERLHFALAAPASAHANILACASVSYEQVELELREYAVVREGRVVDLYPVLVWPRDRDPAVLRRIRGFR